MEQVEPRLNKKLISAETEEYYNAIRTNILFSGKDIKVIAITSSGRRRRNYECLRR